MKFKHSFLFILLLISCESSIKSDRVKDEKNYQKINNDIILSNEIFLTENARQLNKKALDLGLQKKYEEAEKIFKLALIDEPNNPVILNNLGLIYLYTGIYNKAIKYFEQAIKVSDSTSLMAASNLGLTYYEQMDYARALKILNFSIEKSANDNTQMFIAKLNRLLVNIELEDCREINNDRKAIENLRNNNQIGDYENRINRLDEQIKKLCTTSVTSK